MFAPSQRISASSTNSIRKLSKTSRSLTSAPGSSLPPTPGAPAPPGDVTASRPSSTVTARLVGDWLGRGSASAGRELAESPVMGMLSSSFWVGYGKPTVVRARPAQVCGVLAEERQPLSEL